MNLTTDQVLTLASDSYSANAGKKLANARTWHDLGRSDEALWGKCQGSALYQVRVDLHDTTVRCSCPSRKFPCKHGIGLMLLAAGSPASVPRAAPPDWVAEWLTRREKKAKAAEVLDDPARAERRQAQANKSAAKRAGLVARGLDALDLWLDDLMRQRYYQEILLAALSSLTYNAAW